MKHYSLGKYKEVLELISQYDAMLQEKKQVELKETSFLQLIDHFENENSVEKALEIANKALTLYKFSTPLYTRKAKLLINSRLEELALETLDLAESFANSSFEIDFLRAKAFSSLQMYEKALQTLSTIKRNYFMSRKELSNIHFQEAFIYEKMELFERMFYSLKEALTQNPNNKEALERIWISVELSRKHKESLNFHNQLLNKDAYLHQAWFNLGHAHYYLTEYKKAIEAFEFAFIINNKFEFAYRDCADLCMQIQWYPKALEVYTEMMENMDVDAEILLNVGKCHAALDDYDKAKIHLFKALGKDNKNDEVYFQIGECYAHESLWSNALYFYKHAIRLDDTREDYVIALAITYYHLGNMKKAYPLFCEAVTMAPELNVYWTQLACFLIDNNKIDQALEILKEGEDSAYGADMLYARSICLFLKGQKKKALNVFGDALVENYDLHSMVFDYMPHLQEDKDIKAILKYYGA